MIVCSIITLASFHFRSGCIGQWEIRERLIFVFQVWLQKNLSVIGGEKKEHSTNNYFSRLLFFSVQPLCLHHVRLHMESIELEHRYLIAGNYSASNEDGCPPTLLRRRVYASIAVSSSLSGHDLSLSFLFVMLDSKQASKQPSHVENVIFSFIYQNKKKS